LHLLLIFFFFVPNFKIFSISLKEKIIKIA
jgi:hypothetical protein